MTESRRLLVLTGSAHQIPIVNAAKSLGLAVVVTDRDARAPALAYADVAEVVDVDDREAVLEAARRNGVAGVIAEQTDVAVVTGAFVAEKLALPGVGVAAATRATNKFEMREACKDAGIPTPAYRLVENDRSARAAAADIGYPVVIKPVDSQASRGVTKVWQAGEVDDAFARAKAASRKGGVLVEEMLTGVEGSIESFVTSGVTHVLGYCDKVKSPPPFSFDLRLVYPGDYPQSIVDEIVHTNSRAIDAVGIRLGLAHAEFIVTPKGVRLIEIAARGCGARVVTDLLPAMLGVDLMKLRIRQALGETVTPAFEHRYPFGILRFMELSPGRIVSFSDPDTVAARSGVVALHFPKRVGDIVEKAESGDGRPGFVLAVGETRESVIALADRSIAALDVHTNPETDDSRLT